jgi:hypothetical protein
MANSAFEKKTRKFLPLMTSFKTSKEKSEQNEQAMENS